MRNRAWGVIVGVTGLIGHGKTYRAVRASIELARLRRCLLASNIRITAPGVEFEQLPVGEDGLDVPYLMDLVERQRASGKGLVVLVDEVGIIMPARWWSKFPIRFLFLLSQSRKFKVDMVWTAQHQDQVDKVLRDLTEYTDRVKALPAPSLRRREAGKRPWVFRWTRWIGVAVPQAGSVVKSDKRIGGGWERYHRETESWYSTDEIVEPPQRLMDDSDRAASPGRRPGRQPRSQRNRSDGSVHVTGSAGRSEAEDPSGLTWGEPERLGPILARAVAPRGPASPEDRPQHASAGEDGPQVLSGLGLSPRAPRAARHGAPGATRPASLDQGT